MRDPALFMNAFLLTVSSGTEILTHLIISDRLFYILDILKDDHYVIAKRLLPSINRRWCTLKRESFRYAWGIAENKAIYTRRSQFLRRVFLEVLKEIFSRTSLFRVLKNDDKNKTDSKIPAGVDGEYSCAGVGFMHK